MQRRMLLIASMLISGVAYSQQLAPKTPGRFVALTPPATPENSYPNFLWVLDTQSGQVVAYRIASAKNPDDQSITLLTEQILTESEFYQLRKAQSKEPAAP